MPRVSLGKPSSEFAPTGVKADNGLNGTLEFPSQIRLVLRNVPQRIWEAAARYSRAQINMWYFLVPLSDI
jgi:hypothetical protein